MRVRRGGALATLFLALLGLVRPAAAQEALLKQTFMAPMRDGVKLATDVYLPEAEGAFPVVLMRNPYNKEASAAAAMGREATRRGYVLVVQDTRGRFASEGENLPWIGDGWWNGHFDGVETVEWILQQSWCNGRIGTTGGSALGMTQLFMAGAGVRQVACQQITVGGPQFYHDMLFPGGVFKKAMVEDWLKASAHDPQSLVIWTRHPTYDGFWRARDLRRRYYKVNLPAVHIGGWYDIFAQGTIDAFLGYQERGGPGARGRQKLVMGPWTHGVLQPRAGELEFPGGNAPPNGVHDLWRLLDHYLKGIDNGIDREAPVTYYTMGDGADPAAPGNEWRTADAWPPVRTTSTPFYLHGDRTLSTGKPTDQPASRPTSITYLYDPQHPAPTVGGPQLTLPAGPLEQSQLEARDDVLVFTSAPLEAPLEVTGRVRAHLWASSDAPDTDWFVKLCDVYPDGRSYNLCEGQLRARFREGFSRQVLMEPGQIYAFHIDLWSTSVVFNRGHRLRVQVTSSSDRGFDPNPNTGEPFRASDRKRVARNTIHLDMQHPSHLLLPVAR